MAAPQNHQAFRGLNEDEFGAVAAPVSAVSSAASSGYAPDPVPERKSFMWSVTSGLLAAAKFAQSSAASTSDAQSSSLPSQQATEKESILKSVTSGLLSAAMSGRAGSAPAESDTVPSQPGTDNTGFKKAAAAGFLAATSEIVGVYAESKGLAVLERAARLGGLLEVPCNFDALRDSLLYAQLSLAAYASSESQLHDDVSSLGCKLLRFQQQPAGGNMAHPQWFLCEHLRNTRREIVVVIRGTGSVNDALADFLFEPEMHITGDMLHKGFLEGALAAWNSGLKDELREDLINGCVVTLTGHSYGGALAVALLGMGILHCSSSAAPQQWPMGQSKNNTSYKIVTFGAPAVFHGKPCNCPMLRQAAVEQWVCEDDVVPRLLGSDFSSLHRLLSLLTTTSVNDATLRQVQGYEHLDSADLRILRDGRAFKIPSLVRRQVLQVNGILPNLPKAVQDHRMSGYIERLQLLLQPVPHQ